MTTIWYKSGKFATETPQNNDEEPDFTISDLEKVVDCLI